MRDARYKMDPDTWMHLLYWCDRNRRTAIVSAEKMRGWLEAQSPQDAEYALDLGWPRLFTDLDQRYPFACR